MINKDQGWTFASMLAPKLPVLSVFVEISQVWNWVTHSDEECQTCTNMTNSGILWPAMFWYGPIWLETSSVTNSITVSAVSRTSVTVWLVCWLRASWEKISGIWIQDATNGPICLIRAYNDQFWANLHPYSLFCPRLGWYTSGFTIRGTRC